MTVLQTADTSQQETTGPVPAVPGTRRMITRTTTVTSPRRRDGMSVDWT